jgi:hypothetical protein
MLSIDRITCWCLGGTTAIFILGGGRWMRLPALLHIDLQRPGHEKLRVCSASRPMVCQTRIQSLTIQRSSSYAARRRHPKRRLLLTVVLLSPSVSWSDFRRLILRSSSRKALAQRGNFDNPPQEAGGPYFGRLSFCRFDRMQSPGGLKTGQRLDLSYGAWI